jgi:1-acylglycerone phosphate reductase
MELRPFNVRVMLLSTGMVRSRIADSYEAAMPALSPESPYSSYTEAIKGRLQLSQDVCMDTKVFTKKVVKEALKSNPTRYLKLGGNSATTNVMEQLPRGLRLWLVWKTSTDWTALRGALFKFMAFFD